MAGTTEGSTDGTARNGIDLLQPRSELITSIDFNGEQATKMAFSLSSMQLEKTKYPESEFFKHCSVGVWSMQQRRGSRMPHSDE